MKNVIIFQDFVLSHLNVERRHAALYDTNKDELFKYFRAQVDNNLRLGWHSKDIIICTNLDFEYKDVTIIRLEHECKFNKYFNKQYGIWELLDKGLITEPFWFHDFDDWALQKFEFPEFNGDVGICKYPWGQFNTGSVFVKPESIDIWRLIMDFMIENKKHPQVDNKGDENVVNLVYQMYPELQSRFTLLDNKYNVGCTNFEQRYTNATLPICVAAFKPNDPKEVQKFMSKNLLDDGLLEIFTKQEII